MSTQRIDWHGMALDAADRAYRYFTRESVNAILASVPDGKHTWKDVHLILTDEAHRAERERARGLGL